jgi:purine-nucleoside phosphorylase
MLDHIQEAADYLASRPAVVPEIGMITGTGLGTLTGKLSVEFRLSYEEIPHFPRSTTPGHSGTLVVGTLAGRSVMALEGRFHIYEGYSPQEVTFPVRVMAKLGVRYLLISSASGGLNPQFEKSDLMVVTDHINLTSLSPLVGPNLDSFGPRFPDMSAVYDRELIDLAGRTALKLGIPLRRGVYVGVLGPNLETPAETRFLRMIGADAVGMSTVLEVIAGVHSGLRISAIVVVTNMNLPDCMQKTSVDEVIAVAEKSGATLSLLWEKIVEGLPMTESGGVSS